MAQLTLKVEVCVSGGTIAWSSATKSQRRKSGVTGTYWAYMPFYMERTSKRREVMLAATYMYEGLRAEPVVVIRFEVGSGFYDVGAGDRVFY